MSNEKLRCLVIGCGTQGIEWISRRNNQNQYIGLDLKILSSPVGPFVRADAFYLPFKDGCIDKIHADFALNGLVERDPSIDLILTNPDILDSHYFPPLVRQWYVETIGRSHEKLRRNITGVGSLLRISTLREMWRVLKSSGEIEVLDYDYNINKLVHFAPHMLNESPRLVNINSLHITDDDRDRSGSLRRVTPGSPSVQKIKISKNDPYQSRFKI